jgi:hypothetical protein
VSPGPSTGSPAGTTRRKRIDVFTETADAFIEVLAVELARLLMSAAFAPGDVDRGERAPENTSIPRRVVPIRANGGAALSTLE